MSDRRISNKEGLTRDAGQLNGARHRLPELMEKALERRGDSYQMKIRAGMPVRGAGRCRVSEGGGIGEKRRG